VNQAHFHLIFNHIPLLFPIAALLLLVGGALCRSIAVERAAFLLFMVGSLITIPAFLSGEGAEEIVKKVSEVEEKYIEEHEESAETFAIVNYILGILSLAALLFSIYRKNLLVYAKITVLIVAGVAIYFGVLTGTTGGEVRHSEIRPLPKLLKVTEVWYYKECFIINIFNRLIHIRTTARPSSFSQSIVKLF
jgi:uncharacterized membrane protein